jgi:hypothetical protein
MQLTQTQKRVVQLKEQQCNVATWHVKLYVCVLAAQVHCWADGLSMDILMSYVAAMARAAPGTGSRCTSYALLAGPDTVWLHALWYTHASYCSTLHFFQTTYAKDYP